jgi:F-type H+-transporting ATPase subunit b
MRLLFSCRLFALAAIVFTGGAGIAFGAAPPKEVEHKQAFYVKEGEKFRPATEAEVHAAAGGDAHGNGEKSGGLDFTGIKRWDLGIYTLIVFLLLVGILWKFAWPHIVEGLEKREVNIKSALEQAKQGQADATALLAAAKRQMDEGAVQVKAMLEEARRDADVLRATEREQGAKDAQAERERAKREIDAAKDVALKDIYEQAVRLASLMSEKALRRTVSADDHRRLLDEALADLKAGGKA